MLLHILNHVICVFSKTAWISSILLTQTPLKSEIDFLSPDFIQQSIVPHLFQFDFFERIDGSSLPSSLSVSSSSSLLAFTSTSGYGSRRKRATSGSHLLVEFLEFMEPGTWYVTIFNDGLQEDDLELVTSISSKDILISSKDILLQYSVL